jgi:hypothetical protein
MLVAASAVRRVVVNCILCLLLMIGLSNYKEWRVDEAFKVKKKDRSECGKEIMSKKM